MASIPPVRNLPNEAEPWGRYVDQSLASLGTGIDLLDQKTGNADSALNAAFNQLAAQIEEINKRQVLAAGSSGVFGWSSTTLHQPLYLPISFELTEARRVLVQATSELQLTISGASSSARGIMEVTGAPFDGLTIQGCQATLTNSSSMSLYWSGPATVSFAMDFPAGSYNLDATMSAIISGTGTVAFNQGSLTVQVLGRV